MHNALNSWADKLQTAVLPALPATTRSLVELCRNENVRMRSLAEVVEQDPGLTLALLRRVASAGSSRLRGEVTTIEHGMMMLGLGQVKQLPAAVPPLQGVEPAERTRIMGLVARSYHTARQAREIGRRRKDMEPDELFLTAQLHNLGELFLRLHAPERMAHVDELIARQAIEPEEAQYVALGFGLDHLTLELVRRWGLPTLVQESLKGEGAQTSRLYSVMLANQLVRVAEQGWYRAETTAVVAQVADYLGLPFGEAAAFVHRNAVDAAHDSTAYEGATAAAGLLLLPSCPEAAPDWEPDVPVCETEGCDGGAEPHSEPTAFCLAPQPEILARANREMQTGVAGGRIDLQKVLSLTMDGMHDGLGLNRVVFTLLTRERHQLRARAIAGADNDPLFRRFVIELTPGSLFTRLMDKPQSIWIGEQNRSKFWPLVPVEFQRLVRANSFFATSIFVAGKPVGMFYADRHSEGCHLDGRAYHGFKLLAAQAGSAIEAISRPAKR